MRCSRALTFTLVLGLAGPASANVSLVEMTGDVAFSGIPFSFENPGSIELHASVTPPVFGTVSHSVSNDVHVPATVSVEEPRLRLLSASVTSAFDALSARLEMRGGPALPGHRINREYAGFQRTGGAGRPTEGVIVAEETGALTITLDYTVLIHLASDLPPPMGGLTMGGQNTVCGSGHAAIYLPFRPGPQHATMANVMECVQDGASLDRMVSDQLVLTQSFTAGDHIDFVVNIQPAATIDQRSVPEPDSGWALGLLALGLLALWARRPFRA